MDRSGAEARFSEVPFRRRLDLSLERFDDGVAEISMPFREEFARTSESGELLVSNPGPGTYYERPDRQAEAFEERDGRTFLHTGDIAHVEKDGHHYIAVRLDDVMIVGGQNLYLAEVETVLTDHLAVEDATSHQIYHTSDYTRECDRLPTCPCVRQRRNRGMMHPDRVSLLGYLCIILERGGYEFEELYTEPRETQVRQGVYAVVCVVDAKPHCVLDIGAP